MAREVLTFRVAEVNERCKVGNKFGNYSYEQAGDDLHVASNGEPPPKVASSNL